MNPKTRSGKAGRLLCCSAWVGVVLSENMVTTLRALQILGVVWAVVCIFMMCRSLMPTKQQDDLNDADENQRPRQADQPTGKTFHLCRRLCLLISQQRLKFRHQAKLLRNLPFISFLLHGGKDFNDAGSHSAATPNRE